MTKTLGGESTHLLTLGRVLGGNAELTFKAAKQERQGTKMEKKMGTWRDGAVWLCGGISAIVALFVGLDPLHLSPAANVADFKVFPVDVPADWRQLDLVRDAQDKLQSAEIRFRNQIMGPESLAFDPHGRGPYTGLSDGRVMRWDGPHLGWTQFAITSPNRSALCDPKDPPAPNLPYEHLCGRPLGLRFHHQTGELYIADAYFGLLSVGPEGGLARPLATQAEGIPFSFTNDVDVDSEGVAYFTDSSSKYQRRQFFLATATGDNTGRLLRYDPATQDTKVLLKGLRFPNGVALSEDGSFLFMSEATTGRLWKYWLQGPKAHTCELAAELPGFPDNVRRNKDGHFWVAIHCRRTAAMTFLSSHPRLRHYLLKLPIPLKYIYLLMSGKPHAMILRYDSQGKLLEVLEDSKGTTVKLVSEVEERDGQLWIGSVLLPYIAVYTRQTNEALTSST